MGKATLYRNIQNKGRLQFCKVMFMYLKYLLFSFYVDRIMRGEKGLHSLYSVHSIKHRDKLYKYTVKITAFIQITFNNIKKKKNRL